MQNDPYDADAVRAAMRDAIRRSGKAISSAGDSVGLGERTVAKFLNEGTGSMTLANAVRLAAALGVTVSELIGEASPDYSQAFGMAGGATMAITAEKPARRLFHCVS